VSTVRLRLECPDELPLFVRLTMLRGQLTILRRQFEENRPQTPGALARAERVARSLEQIEVTL
jgi:hypothetical protein